MASQEYKHSLHFVIFYAQLFDIDEFSRTLKVDYLRWAAKVMISSLLVCL